jgi:hypothetical protein
VNKTAMKRCDCCQKVDVTTPVHTPYEKATIHLCDDCLQNERCDRLQMYFGTIVWCTNCGEYAVYHKLGDGYARPYDTDDLYCDDCSDELLAQCEECGAWHFEEYIDTSGEYAVCGECK